MDKAKEAVKSFIGKSGHHDTEVHEHVKPAVTEEQIRPHRHEETTAAVDREVHQHHYHTTVQPLEHKETLPEKHTHQALPVEKREFHHGDSSGIKEGVQAEAAKFTDSSVTHGTTHSQSQAAAVTGEHVHHHVHESVQPVIHKETVQPEVVHTTRPIHEVHHAQAEHHGMSVLPTKTLDEFKSVGGALTGGSQRHEEYEGHPRPYNPEMQASRSGADANPAAHDGHHGHRDHHTGTGVAGTTGTTGTTGGLTGSSGHNVSGIGHSHNTGVDYTSGGGTTSTGSALGGRAEGNTIGRAVDTATGHGSGVGHSHTGIGGDVGAATGHGSGLGTATTHGSSVEHSHTGTGVGVGAAAGAGAAAAGVSGLSGSHSGTSGLGHQGTSSRGVESSTTGYGSTGGSTTLPDRSHTDTSSSTNIGSGRDVGSGATHSDIKKDASHDGVQHPSQGKDPNLVETSGEGTKLKGEGADGSHSAVFGLTPDGHKFDDTTQGHGSLRPAHSKETSNTATEDLGSRKSTSSAIAEQLHDPKLAQKSHGDPNMSSGGSAKPGAGSSLGGQQGFGQVRPSEHGTESKIQNKLDPTTDADNDGKRGFLD